MLRTGLLALLLVLFTGCDPIRTISVSKAVSSPLDESCVMQILRSSEHVREVGKHDQGMVYAVLSIPADLESPEPRPAFGIKEEIGESGGRELVFYMLWIGKKPSPAYREYAEKVMANLQDRAVAQCVSQSQAAS